MKNILICGVLDKQGSTNIWLAMALKQYIRDINIIPINYRTLISEYGMETFENILISSINKYEPMLTIFCKCNGINTSIIKSCSEKSKTWLFFMDSYKIAKVCPEIIEHAKVTHYSSCTSEITVDYFKDRGVKNCFHVFEGAQVLMHHPANKIKKYKADISFIGTKTPERNEYYEFLKNKGYDVKFYGNGWENEAVFDNRFAQIISSSKFILSMNTFNNIPTYFSSRVFETLACGTCTLQMYSEGMEKYFVDGEDLLFFNNKNELDILIKSTDKERIKRVSINGREKVLNNYTWNHTAMNIIRIFNENTVS